LHQNLFLTMEITRFILNPFQVNAFVLINNNECILIDMAAYSQNEFNNIVEYLDSKNVKPKAIMSTHGHIDHICGNSKFIEKYNIPFYMNNEDIFLVKEAPSYASAFGMEMSPPPIPDYELLDGMEYELGGDKLQLIHVPGHSPGSMAFYYEKDAFVITGDALFAGSIGRTDLPMGNHEQLLKSINEKLFTLPQHTAVFPGHGPDTSIGNEMRENPFF
jgi:hydroxyacylglutathione hydrolase